MQALKHQKGQMLSTEIVLAMVLFMASLTAFLFTWNSISSTYSQELQQRQLQVALTSISDQMVLSTGDPQDWEFSTLQDSNSFGLAQSRGILSPQKLSALQTLNASYYDQVREGMGAGRFDLYMETVDVASGEVLYRFGKMVDRSEIYQASASIDRLALMNNSMVRLRVQLWEMQR